MENHKPGMVQLVYTVGDLKLTYGLLALFSAIFGLELYLSHAWSPDLMKLMLLGASNARLVREEGEWYRLVTAALLHGGFVHLLFNSYALYFAGSALEPLLGRAWVFLIFWIGAVGGSCLGLFINSPHVLSVGASGGIMGLLAAMFVVAHRIPPGPERDYLRVNSLQVLVPSLIPIGLSIGGGQVDYGAHAGGAIAGALCGLLILAIWPRSRMRPYAEGFTVALSLVVCAVVLYCVSISARTLPASLNELELARELAPQNEVEVEIRKAKPDLHALLQRYPRDPALHYYQGRLLLFPPVSKKNLALAIEEFKTALAEKDVLQIFYQSTDLEWKLRTSLAGVFATVSPDEVRVLLGRYCGTDKEKEFTSVVRKLACP